MGAMDDLRDSIKIRGFKDRFSDPVTEFKGKFTGFDIKPVVFQGVVQEGRNNVEMHFDSLDIIASDSPWQFPVKDVVVAYSESVDSRWVIFSNSLVKFLKEDENFNNAIGRVLHLKQEQHVIYQGKEKGKAPAACWVVVDMAGASGTAASSNGASASAVPAEKQLLLLLNGRSEQEFNMEALKSDVVKGNSSLTTRILNKTFILELVNSGMVAKDESGKYMLTELGVSKLQSA